MVPFSFADQEWRLVQGGALYWQRENALLVADLHLEKASFFASHGQMLPPYDSRETLERLTIALRETGARRVFCLGDNYHDHNGAERLEPYAAGMLAALMRLTDWVWITGNHDSGPEGGDDSRASNSLEVVETGGVILRHRALPTEQRFELSGHFHPRLMVKARGRRIVRPCAVRSETRLILPAFGALTGGMDAASPEIFTAMQPARRIDALTASGQRLVEYPLWRQV